MIKIGICDDEKIILGILKRNVLQCLEELKLEGEIILFNGAEELLEGGEVLDILFLDIEMPKMDGIEAGKIFREKNKNCKIIVATSRIERVKEFFYINTFRFITKPFEVEEIKQAIEAAVLALGGMGRIEAYKERVKYNILQKDILYIEAMDSSVEFTLKSGVFRKETSLTELEKELDKRIFFRISRHCIVNMAQIEKCENGIISIHDQKKKVSQRRRKEFDVIYREYLA